jgi:hypothetical protein
MPRFGWRKYIGERYGPENGDRIGTKSSPQFLEDRVEELGVRERSDPISCELKLVALYRETSVAVCCDGNLR